MTANAGSVLLGLRTIDRIERNNNVLETLGVAGVLLES